ncbi:MAG: hypothetical protein GWP14_06065 [Actinobacteria bacterium]|nr:hypothetical protein [Actinomycetota bacterium]
MPVNSDNRRARSAAKTQTDSSTWIFWMLLLTGLTVLGACIVTPTWIKCQMLEQQQSELTRQLEQLRISNLHQTEAIEAAQQDVAFNERLLIEELNYHRPGEQALPGTIGPRPSAVASDNNHTARKNPAWLQAFAQPDTRNILLVMSTGLILFAFAYYQPTRRSAPPSDIPVRPAPVRFVSSTSNCYSR